MKRSNFRYGLHIAKLSYWALSETPFVVTLGMDTEISAVCTVRQNGHSPEEDDE